MECSQDRIWQRCPCTCEPCGFKGKCCECLSYHLSRRELTACCFPPEVEATQDRSFARFTQCVRDNKV
jgi:hypothetical protein